MPMEVPASDPGAATLKRKRASEIQIKTKRSKRRQFPDPNVRLLLLLVNWAGHKLETERAATERSPQHVTGGR
jgi:hypothetical protein